MFDAPGTLFSNIYIPVKKATQDGLPDEYTWTMIGYTSAELAQMYATYFGENFLVEAYEESNTTYPYSVSTDKLYVRCDSVVKMNKQKYMKLIELMGYEYNPLWNVDGKETYTYLENSGVNDVTTTREKGVTYDADGNPVYHGWEDTHTHTNVWSGTVKEKDTTHASQTNTNSVSAFDGDEHDLVVESESQSSAETRGFNGEGSTTKETTYNNRTDSVSDTTTYGYHKDTDKTEITHHNAKNGNAEYSGGKDAFGNTVTGGDKYHTEAKVREGNIGVTKTQELIANERENLKFAIIMEFFKDLNEQVLVGIY